ncbi:hypothetical protein [Rhizobium tumorigenes]|uniref:hypothetical protein n=1 Tax=Rhizobium tumorigenes TaxID=2041385 RepID=UPI00241E0034|nr:hypothetical protein [Rhizobium tumorigenes]WFS03106.1 hypothetical protein PR016_20735 [Rhizobium tumorigenes]
MGKKPLENDFARLVIDEQISVPKAINRHLASLSLRSHTNKIDDGFDLALTAFAKADYLTLSVGSAQIEVLCEIMQFEVDLQFCRSKIRHGPGYDALFNSKPRRSTEKVTEKRSRRSGHDLGLQASAKTFGFNADLKKAGSTSTEIERSSVLEHTDFMHIEISCVTAGDHSSSMPLKGAIIQDYVGWHVTPETMTERSGVLARFRVRRPWIKFTWARSRLGFDEISEKLKRLFVAETEADRLKLAIFPALLEKLVHLRLQEEEEREFATLAAACLVIRPNEQSLFNIPSEPVREAIEIDLNIVKNFLEMDVFDAKKYAENVEGANPKEIVKLRRPQKLTYLQTAHQHPKPDEFHWFPTSTPEILVSSIKVLQKHFAKKTKTTVPSFGTYQIVEDLKKLKIIETKDNTIIGLKIDPADPAAAELAHYASQAMVLTYAMAAYRKLRGRRSQARTSNFEADEIPEFEDVVSLVTTLEVHLHFAYADLTEIELEQHLQDWCAFIDENE